jgi:hypothetical protein
MTSPKCTVRGFIPGGAIHELSLQTSMLFGGADRDRTDDLIRARDALSQLSYCPTDSEYPNSKEQNSNYNVQTNMRIAKYIFNDLE